MSLAGVACFLSINVSFSLLLVGSSVCPLKVFALLSNSTGSKLFLPAPYKHGIINISDSGYQFAHTHKTK